MQMQAIKARIAPSPTGPLHLGTARTALFNYLSAKQSGEELILRIDDTDKERSNRKWEKQIKDSLSWLGLSWAEEFRQSERGEVYQKYIEKLLAGSRAYQQDDVIYLKVEPGQAKRITFCDIVRGRISFSIEEFDDFIIAKGINKPLYNLACVIDDHEMKISHVVRGEDHISNTPKQILIQQALGLSSPHYAHIPLVLGSDRSKLSKRHGPTSLLDYQKDYLPEAMFNYLSLLGWNPGTPQEIFSKDELIKAFSLKKVQKGGAIFDFLRLDWFNGQYIKQADPKRLSQLTGVGERFIPLEQERIKRLSLFKPALSFLEKLPDYDRSLLFWQNMTEVEVGDSLQRALVGKTLKGRNLWPPRVAVSGQPGSPSYLAIKEVLGSKETKKRLKKGLKKLAKKEREAD